jgi:bifunctional non-homologous end joining protein LigD
VGQSGAVNRFFQYLAINLRLSACKLSGSERKANRVSLVEYRRKRHFDATPEPRGKRGKSAGTLRFVIQKHAASHLHYDFRLELEGVLKSWAVPKGPSLNPAEKRLAMQVEDHPLEYGNFEGIIPEGEYGGGTVLLWDRGTWEPAEDPVAGYKRGAFKFVLNGQKLHGKWMLVRRGGRRADSKERHWFLFKERDQFAEVLTSVTDTKPLSVATGRDLEAIAAESDRIWGPEGELSATQRRKHKNQMRQAVARPAAKSRSQNRTDRNIVRYIDDALGRYVKRTALPPKKIQVQLASLAKKAPEGPGWLHEIKFDGYRMVCHIENGKVRFISRNGNDWTAKFLEVAQAATKLPVKNAIIDGELVALDAQGRTNFQTLQNAFQGASKSRLHFYAFDLLHLNGRNTDQLPIELRKELLSLIIPQGPGSIRFSDHIVGDGPRCFQEACRMHLEGIVSKRLGAPYTAGRGTDWLKTKCSQRAEFVIGGFTRPERSRSHFGALLMGYHAGNGKLIYAGRVGTGFNRETLASLHARLLEIVAGHCPFSQPCSELAARNEATWVKPMLVAEVEFSNWTDEKLMRHPSFRGLREDKPAKEVVLDRPVSPSPLSNHVHRASREDQHGSHLNQNNVIADVPLTHPDKVLYPDDGITKLDLANYYERVAKWILPHVTNRLLALVRCPEGIAKSCFFQKHPLQGTSQHLLRISVQEKNKAEDHLAVNDLAGLISLVQIGVLEIHVWGSRIDQYEKPDRLIFDLDPDPTVDWPQVVTAAKEVRLLLKELGLIAFLKTTGGKGLHLVVPVQRRTGWDEAKQFSRAVADFLVAAAPDRYIANMSKAARKGKIFVDYLRNQRGATAIAPYSTRAHAGATVSVPISWRELSTSLRSDEFTIRNLPHRLARLRNDPWEGIDEVKQTITTSMLRKLQVR